MTVPSLQAVVELRHKHSAAIEDLNEQMDSLKKTRQQLEKTKQQLEAENADLAHDIKGETAGGGRGPGQTSTREGMVSYRRHGRTIVLC